MSKRDELSNAIRQAVKIGHVGPNSIAVVQAGGTVALTSDEANAAADRMLTWLAAHDAEVKAEALDEFANIVHMDMSIAPYNRPVGWANRMRARAAAIRLAATPKAVQA